MAATGQEKTMSGLESQKSKTQWDDLDREELILQIKKKLMLLQKMKAKCDDFGNKNSDLTSKLKEKELEYKQLKSQMNSVIEQKNDDESKINTLDEENGKLNRRIKDLEEQVNCMTMKTETATSTFQCLQHEIRNFEEKNKELTANISILTAARDEALTSMKALKETVTRECETALNNAKAELASVHEEKSKGLERIDHLLNEVEVLQQRLNDKTLANEDLEKMFEDLQCQWTALNQEHLRVKENISGLERNLLENENRLEEITTEENGLRTKIKDFEELEKEYEHTKLELTNLKLELQHSINDCQISDRKLEEVELAKIELEKSCLLLKVENDKIRHNSEEQNGEQREVLQMELDQVKQELLLHISAGKSIELKLNDVELSKASLEKCNMDLKNENELLNKQYVESAEQIKKLGDSLLESRTCLEVMTCKIVEFESFHSIKAELDEFRNNNVSLMQEVNAQKRSLEEVFQFASSLCSKLCCQDVTLESNSPSSTDIIQLLSKYVSALNDLQTQSKTIKNDHNTSEDRQYAAIVNSQVRDAEVRHAQIQENVERLQSIVKNLNEKVTSLEAAGQIEKVSIECQTSMVSENISSWMQTEQVERTDACTEIYAGEFEKFSIECQTSVICENISSWAQTDRTEMEEAYIEISPRTDLNIAFDSGITENDAATEAEADLTSILVIKMADTCTETADCSSDSECSGCRDARNQFLAEKEAHDSMISHCVKQIWQEEMTIEHSLRAILQCISETELDDNENSEINTSLSQLNLLLDRISDSAGEATEELKLSQEVDRLSSISEVILLFESVIILKVQKWKMCFQTLNNSLTNDEARCSELQKIIEEKEKGIKDAEELVNKYKSIAIKVKKEAAELKKKMPDVSSELDKAVSERDHYKAQLERTSGQLAILNKEKSTAEDLAKTCEMQLTQEKEKHKQTLSKLEHALKDANQSNLMSLEFADYERLVNDLNKQMELKNAELSKRLAEIKFQEETIQGFKMQIGQLENQKEQSETRAEQLKSLSVKLKNEITDLRKAEGEWMAAESGLQVKLESLSRDVENYKVQIADSLAENQKLQASKELTQDAHQRAIRILENRITHLTDELQKVKNEFSSCQLEYENYKVRAHSVLKHKKSKTGSSDTVSTGSGIQSIDSNLEEKQHLEKAVEVLQGRVQELIAQLTATRTELDTLQEEHDNLLQRHNSLVLTRNEQDMSWRQRVERLQKELLHERQEHTDTLRHLQQQQQLSLNKSLKEQLEKLRTEHNQQLEELQLKLDLSSDEISRLQKELAEVRMTSSAILAKDDDLMVDFLNSERQEGEGSEFTDTVFGTPQRSAHGNSGFVPFDQLLNQDKSSITSVSTAEVEKLESQVSVATKRIEHLTEILHESEATNARMTEQARVLKEEIRRLERNQEREQHLANMEYVKNIIVKFFSLPIGDERERLVPVLTTILRLSPEEEQQVQAIAKGGTIDTQTVTGWSSYLPIWPKTS